MLRRTLVMMLILLTGISLALSPMTLAAASEPANREASFRLQLEEAGELITVSLWGDKLEDLYAFEVQLQFDAARLRFHAAKLPARGFALEPITEGNSLKLVHTKIGAVAGDKGAIKLGEITFERIRTGAAFISYQEIALVDSQLLRRDLVTDARLVVPANIGKLVLSDLNGHWAQAAISEAARLGLVQGYADGTFKPNRPVTRAEFASLLVRALNLPAEADAPLHFADWDRIQAWAKPNIAVLVQHGLINGYEDGTFRAEQSITRAEMAVMIARALDLPVRNSALETEFTDKRLIPTWAISAAASLEEAGLMKGRGAGRFAPQATATRAEAATLILSVYHYN